MMKIASYRALALVLYRKLYCLRGIVYGQNALLILLCQDGPFAPRIKPLAESVS